MNPNAVFSGIGPASPTSTPASSLEGQAREARFGLHVAGRLSVAADALPHDVSERLRFARARALELARTRAAAGVVAVVPAPNRLGWLRLAGAGATGIGGVGTHGMSKWAFRLAAVAPLIALVGGLVFIQRVHDDAQIAAAAEIDTALLSDELPPTAYSDPGFAEFLRKSPD